MATPAQMIVRSLLGLGLAASCAAGPVTDWGPLGSWETDGEGRGHGRGVGPIVEWAGGSSQAVDVFAIRPFYVRTTWPGGERVLRDILWPVGHFRTHGNEIDWWFLNSFGFTTDRTNPAGRYRVAFLPLLFWGRDAAGEDYLALFPLGGDIHEFIGLDEVSFFLFPLYSRSRLNDLEAHNVLWPFISRTTGHGVYRFRIFPLYGRSERAGEWDKTFVMWPLWTSAVYHRPGVRGRAWTLFPLCGHYDMENQESWLFLPPLFRWTTSAQQRKGYFLWPLVQTASGEVDKFYVWPLWGWRETALQQDRFFLWPIFVRRNSERPQETVTRQLVVPLIYTERRRARVAGTATGGVERTATGPVTAWYFKLWPLFSYRAETNRLEVRSLDLWPAKEAPGVDRCLAPFWTLYAHRRTAAGAEDEALWGLWRSRRPEQGGVYRSLFPLADWAVDPVAGSRSWTALKGLAGYRRDDDGREYRLLYCLRWRIEP